MNEYDADGQPLLLSIRVLKSGTAEGLELEEGRVMRILLRTALKLIKAGYCERKNPKTSKSPRGRISGTPTAREYAVRKASENAMLGEI